MDTQRQFLYKHQAKFAWKLLKHGAGVVTGSQSRENSLADSSSVPSKKQDSVKYLFI